MADTSDASYNYFQDSDEKLRRAKQRLISQKLNRTKASFKYSDTHPRTMKFHTVHHNRTTYREWHRYVNKKAKKDLKQQVFSSAASRAAIDDSMIVSPHRRKDQKLQYGCYTGDSKEMLAFMRKHHISHELATKIQKEIDMKKYKDAISHSSKFVEIENDFTIALRKKLNYGFQEIKEDNCILIDNSDFGHIEKVAPNRFRIVHTNTQIPKRPIQVYFNPETNIMSTYFYLKTKHRINVNPYNEHKRKQLSYTTFDLNPLLEDKKSKIEVKQEKLKEGESDKCIIYFNVVEVVG